MIIRNCHFENCGGAIHLAGYGIVDGLDIDGLTVVNTPTVISGTATLRNARVRNVVHHPTRHPIVSEKIGRNDPCWCGSNKKFKKCCGA
jgi:uncharacterized protein YecA (UPF0149 family)